MHKPSLINQWLALESVAFQEKVFGRELEAFFTSLREKPPTPSELRADTAFALTKGFHDIVKKHTGMTVHLSVSNEYTWIGPCVHLPLLHLNHIFTNEWKKPLIELAVRKNEIPDMKKFTEAVLKHRGQNSINLKTGRVSGIWQDIDALMGIPIDDVFSAKYTVAQLAGLSLHEVGHLFTYFEHFGKTATTNQVIAGLAEEMNKTEDRTIRSGLFQDAAEALGVQIPSFDLSKKKDVQIALTELLSITSSKSSMGSSEYDVTSAEAMADQYAARHGYALEIAQALEAGGYIFTSKKEVLRGAVYVAETVSFGQLLISSGFLGAVTFGVVGLLAAIGAVGALAMCIQGTSHRDFTYDNPHTRIKRLREQMIHLLKNNDVGKETHRQALNQIAAMDELLKTVVDMEYLLDAIVDYFKPFNTVADRVKLHRRLEELANNDLFVAAAKLRQL